MPSAPSHSYVLGNATTLLALTPEERKRLDQEEQVFTLNFFPQHWRMIGFRPTVWVIGDAFNPEGRGIFQSLIKSILRDRKLQERLRHIFISSEMHDDAHGVVEQMVEEAKLQLPAITFHFYDRGDWEDTTQHAARSLGERILHLGSTTTDVVNLAALMNPGGQVRLAGCTYLDQDGYFYATAPVLPANLALNQHSRRLQWEGFTQLRRDGIDLVDCGPPHAVPLPPELALPREPLFGHAHT